MAIPTSSAQWIVQPKQGLETLTLHPRVPLPALQDDEILVRIEAVSLNYRDVGIPNGNYPMPCKPDLIPCSDAAGTVIAVGNAVRVHRVGDTVCSLFDPDRHSGNTPSATRGKVLGGAADGVLRTYAVFRDTAVVPAPRSLDVRESAALPCAAVTAWNALFGIEGRKLRKGDVLLAQGTGGVSLFAVQFAAAIGATVIATTSSDAKAERLRARGATHVINYRTDPEWGTTAKKLTADQGGAHHVIEVGGETTMRQSLEAIRCEGVISIIGFLGGLGGKQQTSFLDCLRKRAIARGVNVGSREQFEEMNAFIDQHSIRPVLDAQVFDFEEAPKAFDHLWDAKHVGKIVIDVSGHDRKVE